jgi:hypothetical protein
MRRRQHILGLLGSSRRRSFVCFFSQICNLGGFGGVRGLEIFSVSRWRSSTRGLGQKNSTGQRSVLFLWRIFAIWRQQFSITNYVEYSFFSKLNCQKSKKNA